MVCTFKLKRENTSDVKISPYFDLNKCYRAEVKQILDDPMCDVQGFSAQMTLSILN
jgi:hypothetical protein